MKAVIKAICITFAMAALCAVATAQGKVDGTWDLTIESPQGTRNATAVLKTDGEKVSGAMKRQQGDLPLTGTIKGTDIKLIYSIKFQDQDMTITLSGKTDKDSMKGDADFGGFAQGTWSGKRHQEGAAPAAAAGTAPSGSNITGNWAFEVQTDQGSGSPSFTFKQDGEKLTGTYKGAFGEGPVEGTVKGNAINFTVKVNAQGQDVVITYTGTIESGAMKGTVKLGDLGTGTWSGKRQ
jgi:hypothetical protein